MSEDTKTQLTLAHLKKTRGHYQRGADLMGELMLTLAKQEGREVLIDGRPVGPGVPTHCCACGGSLYDRQMRGTQRVYEWDGERFHSWPCVKGG